MNDRLPDHTDPEGLFWWMVLFIFGFLVLISAFYVLTGVVALG